MRQQERHMIGMSHVLHASTCKAASLCGLHVAAQPLPKESALVLGDTAGCPYRSS